MTAAATRRCLPARTSAPATTNWSSPPATICGGRREAARAGLPRQCADPLRHGRGQALSRAAADLALWLFDLQGELRHGQAQDPQRNPLHPQRRGYRADHVAPEETLLDCLRLHRSLRGTKEGCAEGDCGACTVLVGRLSAGRLVYESVNACIRFLGSLDGSHVVTVEHLRGDGGKLHPVQQAMVDFHGSQCGFCTPGFVMSLYALWMRSPEPSDAEIEKALQGNLCRCTGYEAIMRAAQAISSYGKAAKDPLAAERKAITARLAALERRLARRDRRGQAAPDRAGRCRRPRRRARQAEPGATIVAGSTDVGLWVTKHMRDISPVVFIGNLDGLRTISEDKGVISIGAGVTYSEAFSILRETHSGARAAVRPHRRRAGAQHGHDRRQHRQRLADRRHAAAADRARRALTLRRGKKRRTIPLEDFFIAYGKQDRQPGEFVEAVHVPVPAKGKKFAVYKITKRRDEDITAALGAFHLTLAKDGTVADIRIAYGGMAATPKRALAWRKRCSASRGQKRRSRRQWPNMPTTSRR